MSISEKRLAAEADLLQKQAQHLATLARICGHMAGIAKFRSIRPDEMIKLQGYLRDAALRSDRQAIRLED